MVMCSDRQARRRGDAGGPQKGPRKAPKEQPRATPRCMTCVAKHRTDDQARMCGGRWPNSRSRCPCCLLLMLPPPSPLLPPLPLSMTGLDYSGNRTATHQPLIKISPPFMNINARSAGPPSCFLLASRSPVSCSSEKARISDAPHAPASRRPRCRCPSRWPRASLPQLRYSRTPWPGLERRADKPPLKTSGAWPRCSRPAVWMMRHHPQRPRAAYTQISFHSS